MPFMPLELPMTDTSPYGTGERGARDDRPPSPPHLLAEYATEDQCAAEIYKSKRTMARWRRLNMGPPVTYIGQTPMYRRASVAAWLIEQEREIGE